VWRSFVALWWDRFGTQQVSVADLYELALQSGIPLARGDEHAKRTSLGQALRRMRDRIYATGGQRLRVRHEGSAHGVQRWALEIVTDRGTRSPDVGGPSGPHPAPESAMPGGPLERPTGGPPEKTAENQSAGGPGWPGGPLSPLRVCAHTRATGEPGKGPRTPPGPPSPGNPRVSGGGPRGGLQNGGPPGSNGGWEELI
jgi:hypothetical protein